MHESNQNDAPALEKSKPLVVFMHVPKAARSTLEALIKANYGAEATVRVDPRDALGSFQSNVSTGTLDAAHIVVRDRFKTETRALRVQDRFCLAANHWRDRVERAVSLRARRPRILI
ncbi:MAG: hypothetical protein O2923_05030 [Verrucomicrobia bacterium]|nr:hypothetical protein [Verrucomicrobiota bacterium]MDA1087077.1 hypothetical protein [Verrucomicrobiota bacterium]